MTVYPDLEHIPLDQLISAAGDPWAIDATLQSGDPGQISELATAFRDAGACTTETWQEFERARVRFRASWNRQGGDYPVNDCAEVQRAQTNLFIQSEQLPAIAVDLQKIAADLAEAQRMSDLLIDMLNGRLRYLDVLAREALACDDDTSVIAQHAVKGTATALTGIDGYRDSYAEKLQAALTDLRLKHGYDPAALEDVDGDAEPGHQQRASTGTESYDQSQRETDEELVNDGRPMTVDKAEAAARLRDFATANDPTAPPEVRRLAGERLDTFQVAHFVGPLPRDPVLGGDARSQARIRLEAQRRLEQGFLDMAPMTPDHATQALDNADQFGRQVAVKRAYFALTTAGVSGPGAKRVIDGLIEGGDYLATGIEAATANVTDGRHGRGEHGRPLGLSAADAHVLEKIARRAGHVGDLIDLGMALNEFRRERVWEDLGESAGGTLGGAALSWTTLMAAGSFTGPWTTAGLALAALYLGGEGGEWVGATIGKRFDNWAQATEGR